MRSSDARTGQIDQEQVAVLQLQQEDWGYPVDESETFLSSTGRLCGYFSDFFFFSCSC